MYTSILHLKHKSTLTVPFGKLQPVLDWCNHNCEKDWAWSQSDTYWAPERGSYGVYFTVYDYTFSFESEKDCIAFILVHE